MTHLFKVQLQYADMFISKVNLEDKTIIYQIRDKETGKLLEPVKKDNLKEHKGSYFFEQESGRSLPIQLVEHINQILC